MMVVVCNQQERQAGLSPAELFESVTLVEVTDQLGCLHVTGQISPPDEG